MAVLLANNAKSKLASSLTSGATTLSVLTGEGSKFPSPTGGDWFPLTLVKSSGVLEIVKCTARSGDVLTVTRGQEGTSGIAFDAGDRVELRLTYAVMETVFTLIDGKQPVDGLLTAIAALTTGNGKFMAFTGTDAVAARDIVGTVSDSGGLPNGAIIEAGSSSSGSYARFADGTQICFWRTSPVACNGTSLMGTTNWFRTTSITWTYPAAFAVATIPSVTPSGERSSNTGIVSGGLGSTPTNTSAEVFAISTLGDGTVRHVLIAIGRWK